MRRACGESGKERTMTERQLYQAFDLHRFVRSARLQAVIDASHARTEARELSDDELDYVSAAGVPETGSRQNKQTEEPRP